MQGVEILEVVHLPLEAPELLGASVGQPIAGGRSGTLAVEIAGWALARGPADVSIELAHAGVVLRRIPLGVARPDIAEAHPDVEGAATSGFRSTVSLLGMDPEFEFRVNVVVGKRHVPLAVVRGRRERLETDYQPKLSPLLVTTLGRTGSTWVTWLLSQHPEIVSYRPFQSEPRFATYWMEVLRALAEPTSYLRPVKPVSISGGRWWLGDEDGPDLPYIADPEVRAWLGHEHIRRLAAFCQQSLDGFYDQVLQVAHKPQATLFAEKLLPNPFVESLTRELYPGARQLVLVRDFRDVLCSIVAYREARRNRGVFEEFPRTEEESILALKNSATQLLRSWKRRHGSAMLLRYEDLIERPEPTLGQMFEHLGVRSDSETVSRTLDAAKAARPDLQRGHQTSEGPSESIGRWRRDLSPSLQVACTDAYRDLLLEFGYEPEERQTPKAQREPPRVSDVAPVSAGTHDEEVR